MLQTLSKSRFGLVAKYYWPRLKWQVWFYPLCLVLSCLLTDYNWDVTPLKMLGVLAMLLSLLLFVCGPVAFTTSKGELVDLSLPVSCGQRCAFIFVWSYVVIPLLYAIPIFVIWLFSEHFINMSESTLSGFPYFLGIYFLIMGAYVPLSISLFWSMWFTQNPRVSSIVATLISCFVLLILFIVTTTLIFSSYVENLHHTIVRHYTIVSTDCFEDLFLTCDIVLTLIVVGFSFLSFWAVKNKQM